MTDVICSSLNFEAKSLTGCTVTTVRLQHLENVSVSVSEEKVSFTTRQRVSVGRIGGAGSRWLHMGNRRL